MGFLWTILELSVALAFLLLSGLASAIVFEAYRRRHNNAHADAPGIFEDPKSSKQIPCPYIADPAEKYLSLIVPAYNEELRLPAALEETMAYLQQRAEKDKSFTYEICSRFPLPVRCSISDLVSPSNWKIREGQDSPSLNWRRQLSNGLWNQGVDFKIKQLTIGGKRLKLTIWDTAGQERFGTLTSSYYRGAHGIILVYDVTRRETFTNLSNVWAKEVELYSTNQDCIKFLVGNKVDRESERVVSREERMALAQKHKCSFLECSAKRRENVQQCFKDLVPKILDVPNLLEKGSVAVNRQKLKQKQVYKSSHSDKCCLS